MTDNNISLNYIRDFFWFAISCWSLVLFFTGLTRQSCIYGFFLCFLGGNGSIFINNCTQKI